MESNINRFPALMPHHTRPSSSTVRLIIRFLGRLSPFDCFREERFWRYAFLPFAGSILVVLILSIYKVNSASENLVGLASAVARVLPAVLFIRVLDREAASPFRLRVSWPSLMLCFVAFSGVIVIIAKSSALPVVLKSAVYPLLLIGLLAGIASAIAPRQIIRRAARHKLFTSLAFVGLLPYVHHLLLAPQWRMFHPISIGMMRWLLDLAGIDTRAGESLLNPFGLTVLIQSEYWELFIAKECSGFARIIILIAFFVSMLLQSPARLRSPLVLALSFIGGVMMLLGVEAARWAALVAFANATILKAGRTPVAYQMIEAYHHAGGQWSVFVTFILMAGYFYGVSRWLDRRAQAMR